MEAQTNSKMIEATDALEAVEACRWMKNLLFLLIILAMFICQLVFWMNWFGLVDHSKCHGCVPAQTCPVRPKACPAESECSEKPQASAALMGLPVYLAATVEEQAVEQTGVEPAEAKSIEESVEEVIGAANVTSEEKETLLETETDYIPADIPAEDATDEMLEPQVSPEEDQAAETEDELSLLRISCRFACVLVAVCNFVIVAGSILYCLTLLMCFKISLAGRLGGVNHIARSFFVSLFLLMVVIPWQQILPGVLLGSVWLPGELLCGGWAKVDGSVLWRIAYYLRFCGLWIVGLWLLWWANGRSKKWARATLRRLGVVR